MATAILWKNKIIPSLVILLLCSGFAHKAWAETTNYNIQVILANFSNAQEQNLSRQDVQNQLDVLNSFFSQASYGKVSLSGKVFGWYTLPMTQTCSPTAAFTPAIEAARKDPGFVDNSGQTTVVIAPFGSGYCGWVGYTAGYGHLVSIDSDAPGLARAIAHELTHDLWGALHAASYYCGDVAIKDSGCQMDEYGDIFDVLGKDIPGGLWDFNAPHKEFFGWFNDGNVQTVRESKTYALEPIETGGNGLKALKIPRKVNEYLYVEYRQPTGLDSNVSSLGSNIFSGALLHTASADLAKTYLINPVPSLGSSNVTLGVGNKFTDPLTGTVISVLSQTSRALTVQVDLGSRVWALGPSVSPAELASAALLPSGSLIVDKGTVYIIHGQHKQGFANLPAFLGLGFNLKDVIPADSSRFSQITPPITSANISHPVGSWVLYGKTVYYVGSEGMVPVPTWDIFLANGGKAGMLVPANNFDIGMIKAQPAAALLTARDNRVSA